LFGQVRYIKEIFKKLTKVKPARLKLWAFLFLILMAYLSWFKFTPSDWIMGKIQRTPEITQARFMRLICLYWNKQCILSYEDAEIEIDKEHIEILLSKKIIKVENDFLVIEFLNEQMGTISETSQKRKDAVLQRWARVKQNDTSVLKLDTNVLQNDTDKIREEKITTTNNAVIKFEDAVKICLFDENWKEDVERVYKIDRNKIQFALTDFTNHCGTIGEKTDKSLKNFQKHFTNWVRIKKQYAI